MSFVISHTPRLTPGFRRGGSVSTSASNLQAYRGAVDYMSTSLGYTLKIPTIIYGTAWKKEMTADLVYKAIKHGFRAIDTACQPKHYNEHGVS